MPRLGEGVLQRRSAVAHRLPSHLLWAVNVPQGHIVEGVKDSRIHVVRSAHGELLRVAPGSTGDKLMGHQHIADGRIHFHGLNGRRHRVRVGGDLPLGEAAPDMGGLHKRQQVELHRAVLVGEDHGFHLAVIDRGQVDAAALHEPTTEGHTLRGVVVAADDKNPQLPLGQAHQEVVQQRHRLGGGHRLVVDITGNQHPVRLLPVDDLKDFSQNILLVLQHGKIVDPLAQMQVGEMNQFHSRTPSKAVYPASL